MGRIIIAGLYREGTAITPGREERVRAGGSVKKREMFEGEGRGRSRRA